MCIYIIYRIIGLRMTDINYKDRLESTISNFIKIYNIIFIVKMKNLMSKKVLKIF
jgi:hypothetical protein